MFSPFVSIVIPIYNRENTLQYCIGSVLGQDYEKWELLLIDDGSTDGSAKICKSYCEKDKRIKYFYQDNAGAGAARNKGIEEASGDWITFVDSDDAIMPNHLTQLQKYGEDRDCVMVCTCSAIVIDGRLHHCENEGEKRQNVKLDGNKNIIRFLYGDFDPYHHATYACWDKFFKMSVISEHSIRFPIDVPTGQDQVFVVRFFMYINAIYISNAGTYAMTPMGNEGIDHLACQLRLPEELFYCQKVNYETLMNLSKTAESKLVREYAVNYILTKPFIRIILPYTKWRNRLKVGKNKLLHFVRSELLPIAHKHASELHLVKNEAYREYWKFILSGQEKQLYNELFKKNLKEDVINAFRRRWKRLKGLLCR
jgi:glycosyltransferase involved in cell wall biosynthesis